MLDQLYAALKAKLGGVEAQVIVAGIVPLSAGVIAIVGAAGAVNALDLAQRVREVNASLSGGELKRIEIAMINARGTKLSIFDEPEAGIDLWSFNNLIQVFRGMYERTKGTILIISHQERILDIADKIIVIANGEVSAYGAKNEILPELLGAQIGCRFLGEVRQ